MTTLYLLDTDIVSYYLRRQSAALEGKVNRGLKKQSLAVSALTRAELRFGQAAMAPDDRRRELIDQFLLHIPNLLWTNHAADCYGAIKDTHKRKGTPIGELDTLIAAHALAEGLILVSHNTRHFTQVAGLKLEDWMS